MAGDTKVFVGSDHAGFPLKEALLKRLGEAFPDVKFEDLGTRDESSCDYPAFARKVAESVASHHGRGLLICGSGIGMSIAANKVKGVRAALAWDVTSARLSREHNDSNVLCLGARLVGPDVAFEAARVWLGTPFSGGRHEKRVALITAMDSER